MDHKPINKNFSPSQPPASGGSPRERCILFSAREGASASRPKSSALGQSTLEVGMAISLTIVLIVATISLWSWGNKILVERIDDYKSSRLEVVHSIEDSDFGKQPTYEAPNLSIFSLSGHIN